MEKRLYKVLALLESENDAEALQALRTAQKMLGRLSLSMQAVVEQHAALRGAQLKGKGASPEFYAMQEELKRYRLHLEHVHAERDALREDLEQLRAFLRASGSVDLFDRLRDRERNVAALTREVRRLKDELFLAERRIRNLEITSGKRKRKAASPGQDHELEDRIKRWLETMPYRSSVNLADWVSAKELYREFMSAQCEVPDPRAGDVAPRSVKRSQSHIQVSYGEFVRAFSAAFGQEPHTPHSLHVAGEENAPRPRTKGFLIVGFKASNRAS